MKPMTRVFLMDADGEKVFGEGPYRLLQGIESEGSLRAAALEMNMAYSKALRILKRAEAAFGFPLTERVIGGRDGGGSRLTPEGKELLEKYETYRRRCTEANCAIWRELFPELEEKQ